MFNLLSKTKNLASKYSTGNVEEEKPAYKSNIAFITDASKTLLMITDGTNKRKFAERVEN